MLSRRIAEVIDDHTRLNARNPPLRIKLEDFCHVLGEVDDNGNVTALAGQCCNVAVVIDFSKYMAKILELDPERRIARVQPGVIIDHLRNSAGKHRLTFSPQPATHDRCNVAGMPLTNS